MPICFSIFRLAEAANAEGADDEGGEGEEGEEDEEEEEDDFNEEAETQRPSYKTQTSVNANATNNAGIYLLRFV